MSWALALMFALIFVCMFCRNKFSKEINEGLWCFKASLVIIVFISFLFVSNSFFDGYADFAKVLSGLYLFYQTIIFIDLFYLWGQSWASRLDKGEKCMKYVLICTALILYAAIGLFNAFNYVWFKGCGTGAAFTSINLVLVVAVSVLQATGINPKGSLICSGSMGLYMTYLTFSALISSPQDSCNEIMNSKTALVIEMAVSFIFTVVVLFYLTFSTKD